MSAGIELRNFVEYKESELKEIPIIKNIPSQDEKFIQDVQRLAGEICEIFKNATLTQDQREDCFYFINELKERIEIPIEVEYMYSEIYLRAENVIKGDGIKTIQDLQNNVELLPLANTYNFVFKKFQSIMKKTVIEYSELFNWLNSLATVHLLFSRQYNEIYLNSDL